MQANLLANDPIEEKESVPVEDVQRLLDLGAFLRSVLTEEELQALAALMRVKIGNARDA